MHHFTADNLERAFRELSGSKAVGVDQVTKDEYARELWKNLSELEERIRRGGWRPKPSREVLIPKPQGGTRSLAVGCLEDKIVQTLTARILEALFEPLFHRHSYGFRRGRSAHQALSKLYRIIEERQESCVVVEIDIEKCFDSISHEHLMAVVERKVSDSFFLRHVRRLLRNSLLHTDGKLAETAMGTPQGSPVSPVLANVFLHAVIDEWFEQNHSGHAEMIRYADDAVFVFNDETTARAFLGSLEERMKTFGLRLQRDKCKVVVFSSNGPKGTPRFLGFELYWGRTLRGERKLKVKTDPKRLRRCMLAFEHWIKATRNRFKLATLWQQAADKISGHFGYFGVAFNQAKLEHFRWVCTGALFRWLNRRSQRRSFTWERFAKRLTYNPLPHVPVGAELIDVSRELGSERNHKPKSRMRKLRTSGSVRSASQRLVFT